MRNYQARNYLRDSVREGDLVLFYHSQGSPAPPRTREPLAIVGTAVVVRPGHADVTAFDPASHGYDPKSDPAHPTWYVVDVRAVARLAAPLTRQALAEVPELRDMVLLRKGSRLSIQPVQAAEWRAICRLAELDPRTGAPGPTR